MRTRLLKWSMVSFFALMGAATASAQNLLAPGTPCANPDLPCTANPNPPAPGGGTLNQDPTFDLANDPGVVRLGQFVVPGDVVLFETSSGSLTDRTTWSDVVEFSNPTGVGGSIATTFPDAEPVGVLFPNPTLSLNAVGLPEITTGTGNDAIDFTVYTAGTNIYQIHSDCSGALPCEQPEPTEGTPEPSSLLLLGTGLLAIAGTVRRKLLS